MSWDTKTYVDSYYSNTRMDFHNTQFCTEYLNLEALKLVVIMLDFKIYKCYETNNHRRTTLFKKLNKSKTIHK